MTSLAEHKLTLFQQTNCGYSGDHGEKKLFIRGLCGSERDKKPFF